VLQNLVSTHCCPTFAPAARLPPLPLATFVRTASIPTTSLTCVRVLKNLVDTHCCPTFVRSTRLPSTSSTCVPTRWITLLVRTAVLHSYALVLCRQHRRPGFARVAEHRWYPLLSYIRTRYSYAVNIVDLRSHVLQSFVGTHCCPTFVRPARMPSTPLTCVRTRCRTSLVHTAVLHSHLLRVCRHCRWLHSYALLVCRQHRRPALVRVAKPRRYALLSYIRTRCSSDVYIVDLHSYALQNLVGTHGCPTFVRTARLPSTSSTCVRTRCRSSLVHTAVLHSYALLVSRQHRQPAFVRVAKPRGYALLSYIRMRCSSVVYIVDLRSYALQNLVGTHCCPIFLHAARLPSLPLSTFVCTAHVL